MGDDDHGFHVPGEQGLQGPRNLGAPNPNHLVSAVPLVDPLTLQDRAVPERPWRVRGWVPDNQVTMLSGDGGIGKSLVAQQLMTACATGNKWLGLDVEPCKALGFFCEDDGDEIHRRQRAINESMGLEFRDLKNMAWASLVGVDNTLATLDRDTWTMVETETYRSIMRTALEFGAQLVVFDSLHDFFAGNENDRGHARQFIGLLRQLAIAINGTVLITAHPSVRGIDTGTGSSGNTAWNNAVRSRLYLTRPQELDGADENDERRLKKMKANYSRIGEELRLMWRDGCFVARDEPTGTFKGISNRSAERIFLELLAKLGGQGRAVSASPNAGNFAPRVMAKMGGREGFKGDDLRRAMERLFGDGRIIQQEYGRYGARRIVIKESC